MMMMQMNKKKSKNWRREKWRNIPLSPSNIDEYLQDLYDDTKGQYVTQGVSFNKDDLFQMNLLRQALLEHGTFSGLIKHLLHGYFSQRQQQQMLMQQQFHQTQMTIPFPQSHMNGQGTFVPRNHAHAHAKSDVEDTVEIEVEDEFVEDEEVEVEVEEVKSIPKEPTVKPQEVKAPPKTNLNTKKPMIQGNFASFLKANPNAKKPSDNK